VVRGFRGKNQGFALVAVLLILFLSGSIAATTAYIRYQGSIKSRQLALTRQAQGANEAQYLVGARSLIDLASQLRNFAESRLATAQPYLSSLELGQLVQDFQDQADRALCSLSNSQQSLRIYFTSRACGQGLPTGYTLTSPFRETSYPIGIDVYRIPFLIYSEVNRSDEGTRQFLGAYGSVKLLVGNPPVSFYQLFLISNDQSNGRPSYFRPNQVWEGPVYIASPPKFGEVYNNLTGPYFLGGLSSGMCAAVGLGGGCSGGFGRPFFLGVGEVDVPRLHPSPLAPCYGTSCPKMNGGVDWSAPISAVPTPDPRGGLLIDASRGLRVDIRSSNLPVAPNPPANQITVTGGGLPTRTYYVTDSGIRDDSGRLISGVNKIYFRNGSITLSGPLAEYAWRREINLSLFADGDIRLEGNFFSEGPATLCENASSVSSSGATPSSCTDDGSSGMLTLVSLNGDVVVTGNPPQNTYIHALVIAPLGAFRVEAYPTDGNKTLTFLGGVASFNYDDFFDWSTGRGWFFQLAYDPRLTRILPLGLPRLPLRVWGLYFDIQSSRK